MSNWKTYINGFKAFLQLEKGLSKNSVDAYINDVLKLKSYLDDQNLSLSINQITDEHIFGLLKQINDLELSAATQARILSGLKSFFSYLELEEIIDFDPTELIQAPKIGRKLPDVLSKEDVDSLISAIDLSTNEGHRNQAILETLYGCGMRVSELINLQISNTYFNDSFVKVIGKGNKERLIPINDNAIKSIKIYIEHYRNHLNIKKGHEDFVFLNRRGAQLTRVMIFTIIKRLAVIAQINKNISPHTFRHSFATHLVNAGANLRAVQEMLGHESITTTEIYTHLDREYLRQEIIQHHPRVNKK